MYLTTARVKASLSSSDNVNISLAGEIAKIPCDLSFQKNCKILTMEVVNENLLRSTCTIFINEPINQLIHSEETIKSMKIIFSISTLTTVVKK
jgi:hypothetical protein